MTIREDTEFEIPIGETRTFERVVVPTGMYNALITAVKQWTDTNGIAKLIVEAEILSGSQSGKTLSYWAPARITRNTRLGKTLQKLGIEIEEPAKGEIGHFSPSKLINMKVMISVMVVKSKKDGKDVSVVEELLPVLV